MGLLFAQARHHQHQIYPAPGFHERAPAPSSKDQYQHGLEKTWQATANTSSCGTKWFRARSRVCGESKVAKNELTLDSFVVITGLWNENSPARMRGSCSWVQPLAASMTSDTRVFFFSFQLDVDGTSLWDQLLGQVMPLFQAWRRTAHFLGSGLIWNNITF